MTLLIPQKLQRPRAKTITLGDMKQGGDNVEEPQSLKSKIVRRAHGLPRGRNFVLHRNIFFSFLAYKLNIKKWI